MKNKIILLLTILSLISISCKKFLDADPSRSLDTQIKTIEDLDGIINRCYVYPQRIQYPNFAITDDYYIRPEMES